MVQLALDLNNVELKFPNQTLPKLYSVLIEDFADLVLDMLETKAMSPASLVNKTLEWMHSKFGQPSYYSK